MTEYAGKTFFAMDGSYGDATEMIIVDTSMWTGDDWQEVENATDFERSDVAQGITNRYNEKGMH